MSKVKPFLLVGDAVSSGTGLGRIAGMIAKGIHEDLSDVYQVASAGHGGPGSRRFGFFQYTLEGVESSFILPSLPQIWDDHSRGENGVIAFCWDPSRLGWLAQPDLLSELLEGLPGLRQWIKRFRENNELWIYCPVDADGPNGALTFPLKMTLLGFDRIIAYTNWGADVIRRSIGDAEAEKRHLTALPHWIDGETFYELPRQACRKAFFLRTGAQCPTGQKPEPIADDEVLIGIVATNQRRKDFPLGIQTAAILAKEMKVRLWLHTSALERDWSIPALLVDYGMVEKTVISLGHISDDNMAVGYSASDLSLGIGSGEGFGFPLAESVFCGTPCIHGNYAGGAETLSAYPDFLVTPESFKLDGEYAFNRPTFDPETWASAARKVLGKRTNRPSEYDWKNVWPRWREYLRKAAEGEGQ
ncbi:MAG: hypothetical protein KGI06_06005 [Candidatus Micrarchaeota archaeon]|nr:hypothetical protein [Candidatus Micrarchaeota archaeon]